MSKDNSKFFKEKKIWSIVKDELLACYLKPYLSKVMSMKKPILYIDGFSGKGKFDDGTAGSPLIAVECIRQCIDLFEKANDGAPAPEVLSCFIEAVYADDLQCNLLRQPFHGFRVRRGTFSDEIIAALNTAGKQYDDINVFLYVDPYGVKVLNDELFTMLPDFFRTAELLINFNSFGFIREGCRVMKVAFRESESEVLSDLEEADPSNAKSISELNNAIGGDYWQQVIIGYRENRYDCYEAEKKLSELYKAHLRQKYAYVLDMPIRLKPGHHPKYRMVHATNHPDGCILMADNMSKRTDRLVIDVQNRGQLSLFEVNADNVVVSDEELENKMTALLQSKAESTRLNLILAEFFNTYGVLCGTSRLSSGKTGSILKTMEKQGKIKVERYRSDDVLDSNARFWTESKGQKIMLQWR